MTLSAGEYFLVLPTIGLSRQGTGDLINSSGSIADIHKWCQCDIHQFVLTQKVTKIVSRTSKNGGIEKKDDTKKVMTRQCSFWGDGC